MIKLNAFKSNLCNPILSFIVFLRCESVRRKHTLLINEIDERNQRGESLFLMDKNMCCRDKMMVMEMAQNADYMNQEDQLAARFSPILINQIVEIS